MSRWFRHYAGMMRDDKLVRAAIRSGQSIERVCWVWGAILESASEINDDGRYDFDTAEAAYFLRANDDDVLAVANALASTGRICEGRVVKWGDRQFQSDRSAERQRRYRERHKNSDSDSQSEERERQPNGHLTSPQRHGDAPETETETETELDTELSLANASSTRASSRGYRLPDGWKPGTCRAGTKAALAIQRRGQEWARGVFEDFENHWRAKAGRDACKVDWQATWANWVVEQDRRDNRNGQRNGQHQVSASGFGRTIDAAIDFVREAEERRAGRV